MLICCTCSSGREIKNQPWVGSGNDDEGDDGVDGDDNNGGDDEGDEDEDGEDDDNGSLLVSSNDDGSLLVSSDDDGSLLVSGWVFLGFHILLETTSRKIQGFQAQIRTAYAPNTWTE